MAISSNIKSNYKPAQENQQSEAAIKQLQRALRPIRTRINGSRIELDWVTTPGGRKLFFGVGIDDTEHRESSWIPCSEFHEFVSAPELRAIPDFDGSNEYLIATTALSLVGKAIGAWEIERGFLGSAARIYQREEYDKIQRQLELDQHRQQYIDQQYSLND